MRIRLHKHRGQGGFTLVELIAVIVVLGILAITAIVKSAFVVQSNLDAVVKSLRSNLQFAQDLAMTHGSTYGFHCRSATQYEIYEGAPGTPARNPLDGTAFVITISPVQFSGTPADIPFLKSGSPDIAADATINLVGGGGARMITVQQDTGFVSTSP
jgi:prepilin-type N-terminal cleavage/methylation domain-containing protein